MDEMLRAYVSGAFDPDDLVNALEIDIERLMDLLWTEILEHQEQLGFNTEIENEYE